MTSRQLDEERIFHIARKLPDADAQADYLDQICAGDQALRERVEALLDVHEQEQSFLKSDPDRDSDETRDHQPTLEGRGTTIGRYRLMEQIGEGGMGTVFVAQQERPIRQKVALKVIKPGMDSKSVIARFEAERQALALMDHPNIAKVLDAGTTDSGRPYFAMELVKGVPITEYCDRNRLTVDERLELFLPICKAIQHAHHKGIIHRDIKPSNVLITLHDGKPVPKVIDFGVAKSLSARLTDRTIYTEHFQIVGTLLYMSPEQAEMSGLGVDTRSDVYSLGVLLYELLTGTTPFQKAELDQAGFDEQRRIIREQEPPRASERISSLGETATTVAEHRRTDARKLNQLVRGDLDWIMHKALEKDRTRRYESPKDFAQDVSDYLANEPVRARPPTMGYRAAKYLRRNRVAIAVVGLLIASLTAGLAGTFSQMRRAEREAAAAQKSEALMRQALDEARRSRDAEGRAVADNASLLLNNVTTAALQGRPDRARLILKSADRLPISISERRMIEAQICLMEGRFRDAVRVLAEAKAEDGHSLAVNSMLAIANDKNGDDNEHLRAIPNLLEQECRTFSDHLFRGWALLNFFPKEGIEDLRQARILEPTSHMALLKYAEAEIRLADRQLDPRKGLHGIERAIELLQALRIYLPNNQTIRAHLVWANMIAWERCRESGDGRAAAFEKLAQVEFQGLITDSDESLVIRTHYHQQTERNGAVLRDFEQAQATNSPHNSLSWQAAVILYRRKNYQAALTALENTSEPFQDSFGFFMQTAVLLEMESQLGESQQLDKLVAGRANRRGGIYRAFDWAAFRLLGDKNRAEQAARDTLAAAKDLGKPEWIAHAEFMLRPSPSTASSMHEACTNRFDLMHTHFYEGIDALARSDVPTAEKHFLKVVDLKVFRSFAYRWSDAFLVRLGDAEWPSWQTNIQAK